MKNKEIFKETLPENLQSFDFLENLILYENEKERDEIDIDRYDISITLLQPDINSLITYLDKGQLYIPKFQRYFRWSIEKASKLIESFLLGLPVPPIFAYRDEKNRLVVIDGQQRLLSIYFFIKGKFPVNSLDLSKYNKLSELDFNSEQFVNFELKKIKTEWEGRTFEDLEEEDKNFFLTIPIWTIVVRQIKPEENYSSVFYIFERLNTGGEILTPMEIRRAIYYGEFFKLLEELNLNKNWRKILGKIEPDKKLADIEILLRILYLSANWENYKEPMKERLNRFMKSKLNISQEELENLNKNICSLFELIFEALGEKPFHKLTSRLNLAFLDSFMSLTFRYLNKLNDTKLKEVYEMLLNDEKENFLEIIKKYRVSTDEKGIKERFTFLNNLFKQVIN